MKYYGHEFFFGKDCKGCCPGHDTIYHPWGTRTSKTRSRLKRRPKKVARHKSKLFCTKLMKAA